MLFRCSETNDHYADRISQWQRWFAWYPVQIDTKDGHMVCAWLQTVERIGEYHQGYEGPYTIWEYRYAQ